MALSQLSENDQKIIFECVTAAAKGPFIDDVELGIIFGMSRDDLLAIAARIPTLDDAEPEVRRAIGQSMNNLLRYPHGKAAEWDAWISASRSEVEDIEKLWYRLLPRVVYSSFKVYGPALIDGVFHRAVEYVVRGGGHGQKSEIWKNGKWKWNDEGPGCKEIISAPVASDDQLRLAGVDIGPLPPGYDPMKSDSDQAL